jgi:hypothetical protein
MIIGLLAYIRDRSRQTKQVCERAHGDAVKECEGVGPLHS